ncbi:MAG: DUF3426 domain-containing protein [Rhodocyclales bacterium]|nr:DUF3426 domain-containing protein [Rhodocyclales bacterium]
MLTCCPFCHTTFRVTPEQLKARAGKVRCGKCQGVFNALDSLADTAPATETPAPAPQAPVIAAATAPAPDTNDDETASISAENVDILLEPEPSPPAPPLPEAAAEPSADDIPQAEPMSAAAVRDTALAAGLVAARETTELPGYNKWAEGAFTAPISVAEAATRPLWPFALAAILLLGALAGQLAYHFRAELAVASPNLRPLLEAACGALGCDIPLPRHSELVSIESSDLQIDPARGGLLTLAATLKNRAAYAQAWPLLEITLTDVQDNAVLRRVLQPADYLPAKLDPTLFPPNGEVGIRLWLEAREVAAAGYRLYVFYP